MQDVSHRNETLHSVKRFELLNRCDTSFSNSCREWNSPYPCFVSEFSVGCEVCYDSLKFRAVYFTTGLKDKLHFKNNTNVKAPVKLLKHKIKVNLRSHWLRIHIIFRASFKKEIVSVMKLLMNSKQTLVSCA